MHLFHDPKLVTRDGADHTGMDAFMRCACGLRSENHIECERVTPEVQRMARQEWRRGRTSEPFL